MWRHFLWICWRFSGWVSLILTFFMYTMLCLVTHSCLTLWNPRDCSLPGSFVHEDSPGKNTGVCFHALLQGIFPTQESNPGIFHFRWILYHLSHQGSPFMYIEHLKLAIQLLSPLLLPRVYPKADQGSWGYFRLQFMPQFSCLVSCHQSTVTSCCDERLQICYVCAYGWGGQNCNDYFQRNHLYSFDLFLLLFNHSVVSNSLTPWSAVCQAFLSFTNLLSCSNSCPLSQWCHPTISPSVTPFSSCPQSSPASGSFPMSLFFASDGQRIGPYLLLLTVTGFKVI